MTKIDKPDDEDRIAAIDDEKKRLLDLYPIQLLPPEAGIFDEPTRCYRANLEWTPVIMGLVSWLAEIPIWKDATDESHWGIQQILKFLEGEDCDVSDFQLRQNPSNSCILEQSLDNGETWTTAFDFTLCLALQDKSYQVQIQNQVTYVQPTFQEIYNHYSSSYTGSPDSVYPDLAVPTGDDSAFNAAYCNAVWELVLTACNGAVSYYQESVDASQNQVNVGLGIAAFLLAAISVAGAIPTLGGSLAGLAPAAGLWAAGIALGGVIGQSIVDFFQGHTIDQFRDTEAMEAVTCFIVETCAAEDNSLECMRDAVDGHMGSTNAQAILDYMNIMFQNDAIYAAFLERWNNNKEYADAGINMYCPCAEGFKVWIWDFANGMGEFTFETAPVGSDCAGTVLGVLEEERIKGVHCGSQNAISLEMPFDPSWRVRSVKLHTHRDYGITNGTYDYSQFKMRPTVGTDTGSFNPIQGGFRPNGDDIRCSTNIVSPFYWTGANEIVMRAGVVYDLDPNVSAIYISKVEIMFQEDFAKGGYVTEDDDLCS